MSVLNADLSGKPTVISIFAGCGGSSLGYQMAGYRELLAVEWDDNAVKTFQLNFPDVSVYHGDVTVLTVDKCLKLADIESGKLDILDGSPPCQGFSTAGKRKYDDPRNSLFREFARLLKGIQPKVFVMENVTGLIKGPMKQAYLVIVKTLRDCGYNVKGEVLNAMHFGVAQNRERVIIIGTRNDLRVEPGHPKPQTIPKTVYQAIGDISGESADMPFNPKTETARIMATVKPGGHDPRHHGRVKECWDKPARTLCHEFLGYFHVWHPEQDRPLTLKEWKRLSTFPDQFQFVNKKHGCSQIGNSVPPLFMKAIAQHIYNNILSRLAPASLLAGNVA